jgi:predicted HicB family RNase H-like nuclease
MAGKPWSYTMNIMIVDGQKAKIEYDPEIDTFRGEILGLNGRADFFGYSRVPSFHVDNIKSVSLKTI